MDGESKTAGHFKLNALIRDVQTDVVYRVLRKPDWRVILQPVGGGEEEQVNGSPGGPLFLEVGSQAEAPRERGGRASVEELAKLGGKRVYLHESLPPAGRPLVPGELEWIAQGEFLEWQPLRMLAEAMTRAYPEMEVLNRHRVRYLWKARGGDKLGKCIRASGTTKYFGICDFVIWLGFDNVMRERQREIEPWSDNQVEAILYHELCHVDEQVTEEGEAKPIVRVHDVEAFGAELERYGLWKVGYEPFARTAAIQLKMSEGVR